MLSKNDQKFLLNLARQAIEDPNKISKEIPEKFKEKRGVFVTLHIKKALRGCIGFIHPHKSIYKSIIENAISAAYHDPRFSPLTKKEFKKIKIEISILTTPKKLDYKNTKELLKKLNNNLGIIIKKDIHTSTFLPQVWEQLPQKEQFLTHLCLKAHLNPGEWKNNNLEIFTYKVERFSE